ncbi:MAG: EAL domain-containing protein [Pseudomonadota bacterium]
MSAEAGTLQQHSTGAAPQWVDRVYGALVLYVAIAVAVMLTGIGGEEARHYVGLLADTPACAIALLVTLETTRRMEPGTTKAAWRFLSAALAVYFIGTTIGVNSWLHHRDPFPGVADLFYLAFYPAFFASIGLMIRAAAARIRWAQFLLDATILVAGFGAFFWFLIVLPATSGSEIDAIKSTLSQTYIALNCVVVLTLGVLLLAESENTRDRRVSLLLSISFTTMLLGDVVWSVAKMTHHYLSGDLQDVLYIAWYVPLAAAGRAQLRRGGDADRTRTATRLAQALPYAAMLAAFLVLVTLTHSDVGSPATVMTIIVFCLAMLVMVRQALVLREDAATRERRAAFLVEARYASLIANASDVIMIVDRNGAPRFASPAAERTLGLVPEDLDGRNLLDLWSGVDADRLREFLHEVSATAGGTIGPIEIAIERGQNRYVLEIVGSNLTADPAVQGLTLNFRDITERKALEEQLRQLAFHDSLTLLANRSLFRDRVQHSLALAQRAGQQVAVMFLDLDNFKNINDTLGHDAGDRLLQAVAQRLVKSTRSSDTVARLGGDEFAILVEGGATDLGVEKLGAALIEILSQPFTLGSSQVHVSASIGVAFSSLETGADALLSNADIAMYHAKADGKSRLTIFEPSMQEILQERIRLEADLPRALANEEFIVEYQPIIDLGTRSLLGVEALVRWQHPEFGTLMPRRFIPIAEDCGQIARLGQFVLLRACQDLRRWRGVVAGGEGLRVSVNISGRHLQHGDLVGDIAHALEVSGLEAGNLVIELTESTIMQNTEANLARLVDMKSLGVQLAIDDFGTGYSSLSYLHRFPIDILKIDHSFVSRLTNTYNGAELARAVITLSETLGLDTIAEGIEVEGEVEALLGLGCVAGQGFLFAPSAALESLTHSPFVVTRNALWNAAADILDATPTGRFSALRRAVDAA